MTHLAVPLVSAAPPLEEQVAAAVAAGATLIELRVDQIGDPAAVEALLRSGRSVPYILTIRTADEGGAWDGNEDERIALLERLGLRLPGFVDIELSAWQRSANLRQKVGLVAAAEPAAPTPADDPSRSPAHDRPRNRLILSRHVLQGAPTDLDGYLDDLAAAPASIHKAVFKATDATEALHIAAALARRQAPQKWIVLALGAAGLVTRVLARKLGAFLTFAALHPGAESAAGQPTIAELRGTYRWDALGPQTPVYGVVGWPVGHSRSPRVHNAAMQAAGLDGVYVPLPVRPDYASFAAFMAAINAHPALGVRGLSVTIPHKEHALAWLRTQGGVITPGAQRCGAVNTLTAIPGGWEGANTDGPGALAALGAGPAGLAQVPGLAHVLGAGGVARAIAAELLERGWRVCLFNRSSLRAATLARELSCAWRAWEERARRRCDLLVNATPVGMTPHEDESPFPGAALRPDQTVFETIYTPAETVLLRAARAAGARVVGGRALFLAQAALQFQRWHSQPPAEDSMAQALMDEDQQ